MLGLDLHFSAKKKKLETAYDLQDSKLKTIRETLKVKDGTCPSIAEDIDKQIAEKQEKLENLKSTKQNKDLKELTV